MTWSSAALGDICNIEVGKTPSRAEPDFWRSGALPWLSIADMNQGRFLTSTKESVTEAGAKAARMKLVAPGTLLLSFKLSLGKVGIAKIPLFTNEAIAALTDLRNDVNTDYMYWALRNADFLGGSDRAAMGNTLNKAKLKEIRIPLPPLPEQRRIASILDKADALRAKRRKAIAKLDQLLQSVFLEMFGDPVTNPHDFTVMQLGDVATQVTDGAHHTPIRTQSGIPLLSARNVLMGSLSFSNTDFVGQEEYERLRRRCEPKRGDILISCSGSIGRVSVVRTDIPFVLVRSAALVKLDQNLVMPTFMEHQLRTPYLQGQMQMSAKSSSQANLFQKPIRELKVLVPPIALQKRFEAIASKVAERHSNFLEAEKRLESLFTSLQAHAFSGKLFP